MTYQSFYGIVNGRMEELRSFFYAQNCYENPLPAGGINSGMPHASAAGRMQVYYKIVYSGKARMSISSPTAGFWQRKRACHAYTQQALLLFCLCFSKTCLLISRLSFCCCSCWNSGWNSCCCSGWNSCWSFPLCFCWNSPYYCGSF